MNKLMGYLKRSQRGFTLIEMAVVIAIIGVLAAVATPLLLNYLAGSKEQAWAAEQKIIQEAVDAYSGSSSNPKYLGMRQYPIKGQDAFGGGLLLNPWLDTDPSVGLTSPENPLRGTIGGNPKWRDSFATNTTRDTTEENLNAEAESLAAQTASLGGTAGGWYTFKVTRQATSYVVDTRNFFIDFDKMTGGTTGSGVIQVLREVPKSASSDNKSGASGSYSWYVDADGKVNSVYVKFPTNGTKQFTLDTVNNTPDNRGFITGVFP